LVQYKKKTVEEIIIFYQKLLINLIKSSKKIVLILLGKVKNGDKNPVIQELQKKIKSKIVYKKNYIKEIEYKKLTSSCHVLLSINKKNMETHIKELVLSLMQYLQKKD
jgi:hypothetical protein